MRFIKVDLLVLNVREIKSFKFIPFHAEEVRLPEDVEYITIIYGQIDTFSGKTIYLEMDAYKEKIEEFGIEFYQNRMQTYREQFERVLHPTDVEEAR